MADPKKGADRPPAEQEKSPPAKPARTRAAAKPPEPRRLAPAGEATDPAVHQVLAELQTARANGDDAAVERLTGRLAELGYE